MNSIRKIYLYLFSFLGLVLVVIGSVQLINLGLRTFVFHNADIQIEYPQPVTAPSGKEIPQEPSPDQFRNYQQKQTTSMRERELANALAMMAVGIPLYGYHWFVITNEKKQA